jgi:hypothetical protein
MKINVVAHSGVFVFMMVELCNLFCIEGGAAD